MKVKYLKEAAGVPEGEVRELRDDIARAMVAKGFCEEVKARAKKEEKEVKAELETKEEKSTSKRRTKSRK